jgi:bifunctional DNA-binding transcriptional regulator/antitoxin component of YhaV-PrlF toxin-antitoxin module
MRTTVTSRGRTVIPSKIRRDHAILAKSRLEWIDDGQTIRVVPIPCDPIAAAIGSTRGLCLRLLVERQRDRGRE